MATVVAAAAVATVVAVSLQPPTFVCCFRLHFAPKKSLVHHELLALGHGRYPEQLLARADGGGGQRFCEAGSPLAAPWTRSSMASISLIWLTRVSHCPLFDCRRQGRRRRRRLRRRRRQRRRWWRRLARQPRVDLSACWMPRINGVTGPRLCALERHFALSGRPLHRGAAILCHTMMC